MDVKEIILNRDMGTAILVEFYYICPVNSQYKSTNMLLIALLHVSIFIRHLRGVFYYVW